MANKLAVADHLRTTFKTPCGVSVPMYSSRKPGSYHGDHLEGRIFAGYAAICARGVA